MDLPYPIFIKTMAGLPVKDIISTCHTDRRSLQYCHEPTFWRDLFRETFDVLVTTATSKDYGFYLAINNINNGVIEENHPIREIIDDPQKFIDQVISNLIVNELLVKKAKKAIFYFTLNPLYVETHPQHPIYHDIYNRFFASRTIAGTILQIQNYLTDRNFIADLIAEVFASLDPLDDPEGISKASDMARKIEWIYSTEHPETPIAKYGMGFDKPFFVKYPSLNLVDWIGDKTLIPD